MAEAGERTLPDDGLWHRPCIHFVIFGLSTYSHFAQIGATANRFLLQTLPVFIVTISPAQPAWPEAAGRNRRQPIALHVAR